MPSWPAPLIERFVKSLMDLVWNRQGGRLVDVCPGETQKRSYDGSGIY